MTTDMLLPPPAPAAPAATLWGVVTDQAPALTPVVGVLLCTPLTPHPPDSTTGVIVHHQEPVRVPLDPAGRGVLHVQDGDTDWLVQLVVGWRTVWSRWWQPVPGRVTSLWDLPEVDPATLEPVEAAVPAWTAAVDQVRQLRDDTYALLPLMESVTGAATAVQADALAAIAAAETAQMHAGQAGQHRQAAEQAAAGAAAAAQAIIAQATADAIAAARAETTHTHYDPVIGWITTKGPLDD